MKEFNKSLPWMYFKGIENGDITVLFFEKVVMSEIKHGDLINFFNLKEKIKMYFDYSKIISFSEVTDEIAKKAGFANRELLSEHLMNRFDITSYNFTTESKIDDELFYMVVITDDPVQESSDEQITLNLNVVPGVMTGIKRKNNPFEDYKKFWKSKIPEEYKSCNYTLNDEYEDKYWRN